MEYVGIFLFLSIVIGFVLQLSTGRERRRRTGPRTPARFVHLTGRHLRISARHGK